MKILLNNQVITTVNSIEELNMFLSHYEFLIDDIQFDQDEYKSLYESEKLQKLSAHIYSKYPQEKQAQDERWVSSFSTKLKAADIHNLESVVVGVVLDLANNTLEQSVKNVVAGLSDDVINKINKPNKTQRKQFITDALTKLVKIALRSEWLEDCITEGKTAIEENREPVYAVFPEL